MISPVEFALWWGAGVALVLWGFHSLRERSRRLEAEREREGHREHYREVMASARHAARERNLRDELRAECRRSNELVGEVAGAKADLGVALVKARAAGGAR